MRVFVRGHSAECELLRDAHERARGGEGLANK
jgi:hypothetical protein